ncbi:MAG: hypothetical protein ACI4C1_03360 [Lachnospiraceae bacterium]
MRVFLNVMPSFFDFVLDWNLFALAIYEICAIIDITKILGAKDILFEAYIFMEVGNVCPFDLDIITNVKYFLLDEWSNHKNESFVGSKKENGGDKN